MEQNDKEVVTVENSALKPVEFKSNEKSSSVASTISPQISNGPVNDFINNDNRSTSSDNNNSNVVNDVSAPIEVLANPNHDDKIVNSNNEKCRFATVVEVINPICKITDNKDVSSVDGEIAKTKIEIGSDNLDKCDNESASTNIINNQEKNEIQLFEKDKGSSDETRKKYLDSVFCESDKRKPICDNSRGDCDKSATVTTTNDSQSDSNHVVKLSKAALSTPTIIYQHDEFKGGGEETNTSGKNVTGSDANTVVSKTNSIMNESNIKKDLQVASSNGDEASSSPDASVPSSSINLPLGIADDKPTEKDKNPAENVISKDNTQKESVSTREGIVDREKSDNHLKLEDLDETQMTVSTTTSTTAILSPLSKTEKTEQSESGFKIASSENISCSRATISSSGGSSQDNGNEDSISSTPCTERSQMAEEMKLVVEKSDGVRAAVAETATDNNRSNMEEEGHKEHAHSIIGGVSINSGASITEKTEQQKELIMSSSKKLNSTIEEGRNGNIEDDADKVVRIFKGTKAESTNLAQSGEAEESTALSSSSSPTLSMPPSSHRLVDSLIVSRPPPQRPKLLANLKPKSPEPLDEEEDDDASVDPQGRDNQISSSESFSAQNLNSVHGVNKEPTMYINKRSSLYVKNPDFSKKIPNVLSPTNSVASSSFGLSTNYLPKTDEDSGYKSNNLPASNDLSPLRMKPPDFSKISPNITSGVSTVQPQRYSTKVPEPMPSGASAYNMYKNPPVTPSNFEEISKKYNYISDLQLKPQASSSSTSNLPSSNNFHPSIATNTNIENASRGEKSVQHKIVPDQGLLIELHKSSSEVNPPMKSGSTAAVVDASSSGGVGMYKTLYVSTPEFTSQKFHKASIPKVPESSAYPKTGPNHLAPSHKPYNPGLQKSGQEPEEPTAHVIHKSNMSGAPISNSRHHPDEQHMMYKKYKVYENEPKQIDYNSPPHIPPSNASQYSKSMVDGRRPVDSSYKTSPSFNNSTRTMPESQLSHHSNRPREVTHSPSLSLSSKDSIYMHTDQPRNYPHPQYNMEGPVTVKSAENVASYQTSVIRSYSRTPVTPPGPPPPLPMNSTSSRYLPTNEPPAISLRQQCEGLNSDLKRIQSPSQGTIGHSQVVQNPSNVIEYSRQGYNMGGSAIPNHMHSHQGWNSNRSNTPQSPHLSNHSPSPSFIQPSPKASPSPTLPFTYQPNLQRHIGSPSPQLRPNNASPSLYQKPVNETSRHHSIPRDYYKGTAYKGFEYGDVSKTSLNPYESQMHPHPVYPEKYASTSSLHSTPSTSQNLNPMRHGSSENNLRSYPSEMYNHHKLVNTIEPPKPTLPSSLPPKKQIKIDEQSLGQKYNSVPNHGFHAENQIDQQQIHNRFNVQRPDYDSNAIVAQNPDYSKYPQAPKPPTVKFSGNSNEKLPRIDSDNYGIAPSSSRNTLETSLPRPREIKSTSSTVPVSIAPTSTIPQHQGLPIMKRESPLDLSVKTVKTKADSTGEFEDNHHRMMSSINPKGREPSVPTNSLKVNYVPNFAPQQVNISDSNARNQIDMKSRPNNGNQFPKPEPPNSQIYSPHKYGNINSMAGRPPSSHVQSHQIRREPEPLPQDRTEQINRSRQTIPSSTVVQKPIPHLYEPYQPIENRERYYHPNYKLNQAPQPSLPPNNMHPGYSRENLNRPFIPQQSVPGSYHQKQLEKLKPSNQPHEVPKQYPQQPGTYNPYNQYNREIIGVNDRKRSHPNDAKDVHQGAPVNKMIKGSENYNPMTYPQVVPKPSSPYNMPSVQHYPNKEQYYSPMHHRDGGHPQVRSDPLAHPLAAPRDLKYHHYEKDQIPNNQQYQHKKPEHNPTREPVPPMNYQFPPEQTPYDRQYNYQGPIPDTMKYQTQSSRHYSPHHQYNNQNSSNVPPQMMGSVEAKNWYPPPTNGPPSNTNQPNYYGKPYNPPSVVQQSFNPITTPNTHHLTDVTVIPYIKPGSAQAYPLSNRYEIPDNASSGVVPVYHSELKHSTPKNIGQADRDVISKLKNTIEEKQHQKLMTQKQNSIDMSDDDPNKADIASMLAARIRTKGELKGFTGIQSTNQEEHERKVELEPALIINPKEKIDPPSDMEGTSAFDLMDWGSACNDFVEQLQTGKKKTKRRKPRKSDASDVKLEVKREVEETTVKSAEVLIPPESVVPREDIVKAESLNQANSAKVNVTSTKINNDDHSSSSDENKPLLLLRQQSVNEKLKISESDATSKSSKYSRLSDKSLKNIKEKRLAQEKRIASRLNSSSSDSESETQKNQEPRRRKVARKILNKTTSTISSKESSQEDEEPSKSNRKNATNFAVSRRKSADSRKRKKSKHSSSEPEVSLKDKGKKLKKPHVSSDSDSSDEDTIKKNEPKSKAGLKQKAIKKLPDSSNDEQSHKPTTRGKAATKALSIPVSKSRPKILSKNESDSSAESNNEKSKKTDSKETSVKGKPGKPKNAAAAKSSSDVKEGESSQVKKSLSPTRTVHKRRDTKTDVGPMKKNASEFEKTMTRSKMKLESMKRVLRNDKVIPAIVPKKKKFLTPNKGDSAKKVVEKNKEMKNNKAKEDTKRKSLNSDSEDVKNSKKKIAKRGEQQKDSSSSSSSDSSDEKDQSSSSSDTEAETVNVRLRPRLSKVSNESQETNNGAKGANITTSGGDSTTPNTNLNKSNVQRKVIDEKSKAGKSTPSSTTTNNNNSLAAVNQNSTTSSRKGSSQNAGATMGSEKKKGQQRTIEEIGVNKFADGWEEQLYEFKRSLKVPPSLISIESSQWHRVSTSLPDLDRGANSDDDSGMKLIAEERNKEQNTTKRTNLQINSIIDMVHRRVIPTKINNQKNSVVVRSAPAEEPKNSSPLLPTPVLIRSSKKAKKQGNKKEELEEEFEEEEIIVKNVFNTKVIKSRTRTEQRNSKSKEIIREIFGGDERPASAPPRCNNGESNQQRKGKINEYQEIVNKKMTFEQQYEEYLKMYNQNDDQLEIIKKNQPMVAIEEQATLSKELMPMVFAAEGLQMALMRKKSGKKSYSRRKGSSGFDYIRKKKKQTLAVGANGGSNTNSNGIVEIKRRAPVIEFVKERGEQDISKEIKGWVLNKGVGESVLHKAARLDYLDVVAYCLDRLEMSPDQKDNAGYTPLHEACSKGHLKIAKLLLQYGANHSETAQSGIRPLHDAVENGYMEIVRLLLAYGADPQLATYSGQTPLSLAEEEIMERFLKDHLYDLQYFGNEKKGWRFHGPWILCNDENCGYNVFDGAPGVEVLSAASRKDFQPRSNADDSFQIRDDADSAKARSLNLTVERLAEELNGLKKGTSVSTNVTLPKKKSVEEVNRCGATEEGNLFEFEESEMPLPPLYLLRDEGNEKWVMLTDLLNLLKVKSKETLLKQICPPNTSQTTKEMVREFKIGDFLQKAVCLQLLCSGEKLNIRSSKVILVKYTETVKSLLDVGTVVLRL